MSQPRTIPMPVAPGVPDPKQMAILSELTQLRGQLQQSELIRSRLANFLVSVLKADHEGRVAVKVEVLAEVEGGAYGVNSHVDTENGILVLTAFRRSDGPPASAQLPPGVCMHINEERVIPRVPPFKVKLDGFHSDYGVLYAKNQKRLKHVQENPKFNEYAIDEAGNYVFSTDDTGFSVLISYSSRESEELEAQEQHIETVCPDPWHKEGIGLRCSACGSRAKLES